MNQSPASLFTDPRLSHIANLSRQLDPNFEQEAKFLQEQYDQRQRLLGKIRDPKLQDMARIASRNRMVMGRQGFAEAPYVDPPVGNLSTLTATTIEDLWPGITWTPIFANDPKAGKTYRVKAGGTISLTGGTGIITPQWGPAGTTLGASLTVGTVTAAIAAWYLNFDLVFRTIGAAGANSTCIGTGFIAWNGGVVSGTANPNMIVFGGTSASVDSTINGNITIRKTLSATNSVITQYALIYSGN